MIEPSPKYFLSRLSSLGDVVNTLPVASALKQATPNCHITWLVDPRFVGVVECCKAVDRTIQWKPRIRNIPRLPRDTVYDIAFDMQGLLKSGIPVWRMKAHRKLGYHWQRECSSLFSIPVLPQKNSLHIVDQLLDVVRGAGLAFSRVFYELEPKEEDITSVTSMLKEQGCPDQFVVVNAGSAGANKRWNPKNFAAIIDELARSGIASVLIGTNAPIDREIAEKVISQCSSRPFDLLGRTSVTQLIALLSRAKSHVAGDTGSLHIANAMAIPIVGVYSSTRPYRTGPYGNLDKCLYSPESLDCIEPRQVLDKLYEVMK